MKKLFILLLLSSCVKTEEPYASIIESVDTSYTKAHKPLRPMPEIDTIRVSIGFDPSVEDWEGKEN